MRLDPLPKKQLKQHDTTPAKLYVAGELVSAGTAQEMNEMFEQEVALHRAPVRMESDGRIVRRRD